MKTHRPAAVRLVAACLLLMATLAPPIAPGLLAAAAEPIVVTDARGREVALAAPPMRIVSLVPSTTEIVCAVGACDRLVATDGLSDYPPDVLGRPKLGSGRIAAESVLAQEPDLVLAGGLTPSDLIELLEASRVRVAVVDARSLDEVYTSIELVGALMGNDGPSVATALADDLRARAQAVAERTLAVEQRPTVYHELDRLLFSASRDTFIGSIIRLAGGQNIVASAAVPYPQLNPEYVIVANPDVIVLADAAFGVSPASVGQRPGWSGITAVRTGRVYPIDPDLISRPGPRIVDGLEAYARLLHPSLFAEPLPMEP